MALFFIWMKKVANFEGKFRNQENENNEQVQNLIPKADKNQVELEEIHRNNS